MIPQIPDKFYKLILLIGLAFILYSYFISKDDNKDLSIEKNKYNDLYYEIELQKFQNNIEKDKLIKYSTTISLKYGLENLISYDKDSNLVFHQILIGKKNDLLASDSIRKRWDLFNENSNKLLIQLKRLQNYSKSIKSREEYNDKINWLSIEYLIIGVTIFFMGFLLWMVTEEDEKRYVKLQDKIYLYCQSCGKMFSASREYGTEKNGTYSNCYCKKCYKKGKFTNKNLTKEEFLETAKEEIKNKGLIRRYFLLKRLKGLDRWNPDKYTY